MIINKRTIAFMHADNRYNGRIIDKIRAIEWQVDPPDKAGYPIPLGIIHKYLVAIEETNKVVTIKPSDIISLDERPIW